MELSIFEAGDGYGGGPPARIMQRTAPVKTAGNTLKKAAPSTTRPAVTIDPGEKKVTVPEPRQKIDLAATPLGQIASTFSPVAAPILNALSGLINANPVPEKPVYRPGMTAEEQQAYTKAKKAWEASQRVTPATTLPDSAPSNDAIRQITTLIGKTQPKEVKTETTKPAPAKVAAAQGKPIVLYVGFGIGAVILLRALRR